MNKVYRKLAFTNIKTTDHFIFRILFPGIVTVAMFYIMMFLNNSKGLEKIYGASYLTSIMALGVRTIAVFHIYLYFIRTVLSSKDVKKRSVSIIS